MFKLLMYFELRLAYNHLILKHSQKQTYFEIILRLNTDLKP